MIEYRVTFSIYDTDDGTHKAIYTDTSELSVATLRTIDDKAAFMMLCNILIANLVPEGSTVLERLAIS